MHSFHARLIQEMAERVEAVVGGALDPAIAIDLDQLARERQRGRALEAALARSYPPLGLARRSSEHGVRMLRE